VIWKLSSMEDRCSSVLTESFASSERLLIATSTSATMFLYGIRLGVTANFGPFSSKDCSASEINLNERFTTQVFLSIGSSGHFMISS
jgi:hypothetical protein